VAAFLSASSQCIDLVSTTHAVTMHDSVSSAAEAEAVRQVSCNQAVMNTIVRRVGSVDAVRIRTCDLETEVSRLAGFYWCRSSF